MKLYIGWDPRESLAHDVCKFSVRVNSSKQIDIHSLKLKALRQSGIYTRPDDMLSSTEFTFSRFLVPYLCEYTGWSVFCDSDFLWLHDISELLDNVDNTKAVIVVKHDYVPTCKTKKSGASQHIYPRKNWSSMILWNNAHPSNQRLTPDVVNSKSGQWLHRFSWLKDHEIGGVSHEWNWLTDWYEEPHDGTPHALHYTSGGPWLDEYANTAYADIWNEYYNRYIKTDNNKSYRAV